MKTTTNLRNFAKMMLSLMAAFFLTPAFSTVISDSGDVELADAYNNLDRLQLVLVSELAYTAPDADDLIAAVKKLVG